MKTLKSLTTASQALQSQAVNRMHGSNGLKAVVPQEEGDSGIGCKERTTSIAVFWMQIQRNAENVININLYSYKGKRKSSEQINKNCLCTLVYVIIYVYNTHICILMVYTLELMLLKHTTLIL